MFSMQARGACLIYDKDGELVVKRTRPDCTRKDDDVDRPVVECVAEMAITYLNETGTAFFPNATRGPHGGHGGHDFFYSFEDDEDTTADAVIEEPSKPQGGRGGSKGGKGGRRG
jgi:hypothetical protein